MLYDLGQRIRTIRTNKGISLNAFAEKLGVSPGYLSNLETGKTNTIQLSLLEKLQTELHLFPFEKKSMDELDIRLTHANKKMKELQTQNPDAVKYLLSTLENGIELLLKS
ncbi:helix-turn-helix domain-containing protein [Bacillus aerolatus]|uniref:Helix-turn-helix domain-containing protein n=1 Tax=Bacillus aerolatus TaxID=2653354 RepID=A0A6I1FH36_9BACI|nr:helix-turn-helix domain-containing protein [Bacillus aerolatus]KAB7704910.1 helix-turn-helix domain-containing protein [Bacillus aerolatus]